MTTAEAEKAEGAHYLNNSGLASIIHESRGRPGRGGFGRDGGVGASIGIFLNNQVR